MDKIGRYSEALDAQIELAKFWLNSQTARNYFEDQEKKWDDDRLPFRITTGAILNSLVYGETFYWSEPICQLILEASRSLPQSWALSEEMLLAGLEAGGVSDSHGHGLFQWVRESVEAERL